MKRTAVWILAICLLLSGCGWMDGSYVSVTPHRQETPPQPNEVISVSDYAALEQVLTELVESGAESGILSFAQWNTDILTPSMNRAIRHVTQETPIGAYAVESITWEEGTTAGTVAVAVRVQYRHNRSEIQRIRKPSSMEQAQSLIYAALDQCGTGIVMEVESAGETDFAQIVQNYAFLHPESVMELPQVTETLYPGFGNRQIVELQFAYQTSRDSLKSMQSYVQPVFSAARLYVRGDTEDSVKYAQLFSFLMERYDYQFKTSITPAYSLLRHGVGDSRAFACVYAAMCRQAGLECLTVSGTRDGEPCFWNMIRIDGLYYHADLLASGNGLRPMTDADMQGYVWDYSAYPECSGTAAHTD